MAKQNGKQRAAKRIQSIESKLDSANTRKNLQSFLEKYFLCEMACKEMYIGYKADKNEAIKYEDVKMDLRRLRHAFDHYGIAITDLEKNRLFSSDPKSAKKIRDSLVHGVNKHNLELLNKRYVLVMNDMCKFLFEVAK